MKDNMATMKGRGPKALMLVVVLLIMSFSAIVINNTETDDAAISIPEEARVEKGKTVTITSTGAAGTVTWTTSNASIATVDASGVVTGVAVGVATITATDSGSSSSSSSSSSDTCTVTVFKTAVQSVTLNHSKLAVEMTKTGTLTATVSPSTATEKTVTWTSSASDVATVSSNGRITPLKEGVTTITATADGKSATCAVTVIPTITSLTISASSAEIYHNSKETENSITLNVSIAPSSISYRDWTSSNAAVAKVDNTLGKVTVANGFSGTGTSTITLTIGSQTASCAVTVKDVAVSTISLDKTSVEASVGDSITLTPILNASLKYPTNDKVTWTASPSGIVSFKSATSDVSAAPMTMSVDAEGKVTVTVTTKEGSKVSQCVIDAKPVLIEKVEIEGGPYELEVDEIKDLKAKLKFTPTNATNKNVTWASSDPTKVEVNANGIITGKAPGTVTITVTTVEGSHTATTTVTVTKDYTIEADVTESGGKGNVGNVTELLNKIEATKTKGLNPIVDIDASHSDYVSMTSDVITKLKGIKGAELHIELKLGGMALDNGAMSKLPKGNMIGFSINTTTLADTYAKFAPYYAYDVSIYSGELKVPTNFGGDRVTVAIKYTLKDGESKEKLAVAYVPDKGTPVLVSEFDYNSEYDCVVFETNHCSSFMVLFHDNDIKPEGDGFIVFIVFMIVVIVLIVLITLYIRSANGFKGMFAVNGNNRRQQPPQPPAGYYPPAVEYNNYYNYRR
ncbi:MAG: Ig domain-containing protein [Thermoplasmata archaeon]|nr:Ig domain-containing protein [Thermoplasmata archaeon]